MWWVTLNKKGFPGAPLLGVSWKSTSGTRWYFQGLCLCVAFQTSVSKCSTFIPIQKKVKKSTYSWKLWRNLFLIIFSNVSLPCEAPPLVHLSPSLAFFTVSSFLLSAAKEDHCTAKLCQATALLHYMVNKMLLAWQKRETTTHSLSATEYLAAQEDDKSCAHIDGTRGSKNKIVIYFSCKD